MRVVLPNQRPRPFKGPRTHARLRHDHATWHNDHVAAALRASKHELPFDDRSKFDSARLIDEAIERSMDHPAHVMPGSPNYVICFDMGYEVGFDARANRRTTVVTVVLSPTGEVLTVYPGKPQARAR